jgi:hypothetical protein
MPGVSVGSWCGRRAIVAAGIAVVVLASGSASAQALPSSGDAVVQPSTIALPRYWPRKTFQRRNNGLMVVAIVLASTAATIVASGGVVYGEARDSCLDQHHQNSTNKGHFCYADRSQFDAGMGMMSVGGAVFAISVPLAVWAGSGTPREEARVGLRLGTQGAAITGSF